MLNTEELLTFSLLIVFRLDSGMTYVQIMGERMQDEGLESLGYAESQGIHLSHQVVYYRINILKTIATRSSGINQFVSFTKAFTVKWE